MVCMVRLSSSARRSTAQKDSSTEEWELEITQLCTKLTAALRIKPSNGKEKFELSVTRQSTGSSWPQSAGAVQTAVLVAGLGGTLSMRRGSTYLRASGWGAFSACFFTSSQFARRLAK